MIIKESLLTAILFLLITINHYSQQTVNNLKPSLNAVKIESPIELTGKLDNPVWANAVPVELNYEIRPGDNTPAPQKTYTRVLYDNEFLYFGFECFDTNPKEIRANVSDRDKIFGDDFMIVIFDTFGDYQKSYELAINPYGNQGDLLMTINGEDETVDYIWYSAASINEKGWTAEIKIPFSSLTFPEKEEHEWPLHIVRNYPRASRHQISWMKIDRNLATFMPQAGLLTGLKNIKSGGSLELLPYVIGEKLGALSNLQDPGSDFKFNPIKGRIGGGIKYSPNNSFSLEAVINPDFSQIESDADQIDVNTTFSLYYQERRPFFLTGNDLLQTPMYYSRSINNPLGAARIIGKSGKFSYLYLSAYDRNTVIDVPGEERSNTISTDLNSLANIGRVRYDFGDEIYIGTMLFGRNFEDAHNYLAGFDWNYKFLSNWYFSGEFFFSKTKEMNDTKLFGNKRIFGSTKYNAAFDGENYSGEGIHLSLYHNTKNYEFNTVINNFSPTYQTYNGLFSQVNYRQIFMRHEFKFYPDSSFIDSWGVEVESNLMFNFDGLKKEQFIMPQIYFTMKGQTNLYLSYLLINDENFNGTWFENINKMFFSLNTRPWNELSFYLEGQVGKFIYRSSNPQMGSGHNIYTGFTLRPTSKLNLSFSYSRARLSSESTGNLFYDGNIYRITSVYQFSAEMFLRLITQYNSFDKSFNFYPLFSYKLNAFTTFFAGATSDYLDFGEAGIKNTHQQYFVKLQYLLGV